MELKSVNLEIKSKNLLTMYLIHRNLTHRTQFIANRNTKNSINRGLTHQKLNEDAAEKAGMPPTDTTAPFALLSQHLNQLVERNLHRESFPCPLSFSQ